jgi:hypothetical protein
VRLAGLAGKGCRTMSEREPTRRIGARRSPIGWWREYLALTPTLLADRRDDHRPERTRDVDRFAQGIAAERFNLLLARGDELRRLAPSSNSVREGGSVAVFEYCARRGRWVRSADAGTLALILTEMIRDGWRCVR